MRGLNSKQINWLEKFNQLLCEIQDLITQQKKSMEAVLDLRVADPLDRIDDYEIDVELMFSLRESDPDFREDSDNFIAMLSGNSDYESTKELDWADLRDFGFRNQCYLFHELCDHGRSIQYPSLDAHDILRIGDIWVDIKPRFQYFFDTPPLDFDISTKHRHFPVGEPIMATVTGKRIQFSHLDSIRRVRSSEDDFDLEDIAHGLANQCRFHGQTKTFFSIAQHSLMVASLVPESVQLAALLYSASAAYIGELSPAFAMEGSYLGVKKDLRAAIGQRFGVTKDDFEHTQIRIASLTVLATERRDLLPGYVDPWIHEDGTPLDAPIISLPPDEAKRRYLEALRALLPNESKSTNRE